MRTFALKVNLTDGAIERADGFDRPVVAEPEARLLACTRIRLGEREFFTAGRWYSLRSVGELERWLARFDPTGVGDWAREQDGDFRVVVVDRAARTVTLVADRNGNWRAYHAVEDGHVLIAGRRAEMIGLLERPAICEYAFYQLLTIGFVVDPYSLLDGVWVTHPGEVTTFADGAATTAKYYAPVQHDADYYRTTAECVTGLDAAARRVFGKRLSGAREPVVLLSGGIDSMTMLAYLHELAPNRLRTLTFSTIGLERDELGPAGAAAKHFKTNHTELMVDPADAGRLLLRLLAEADTWNYGGLYALAEREFLEGLGGAYDVFSGEDARMHTPSFDSPKALAIRLNRGGPWRLGRPAAAVASAVLARMPFSGSLKNYSNYWSAQLRPRRDFRTYFLDGLMGSRLPAGSVAGDGLHARLLADLPTVGPEDRMQDVFKKYVAFNIRAQHTDDMNAGASTGNGARTEMHSPFFDWEFVEAFNRVPYRLGARRVFTFKSHSKLPVVQKYVLRKLVENRLPSEVLYRYKATNPSLHQLFNQSLRGVVSRLLDRWLPDLSALCGRVFGR